MKGGDASAMPVVHVRVDDRLIHGQVVVRWMGHLGVNKILAVDDVTAASPTMRSVLKYAAPPGIAVEVASVAEALKKLRDGSLEKDRVLLVAKSPRVILQLYEGGWSEFREVNIGPLSYKPGAVNVAPNAALQRDEAEACDALTAAGVRVYFQLVPEERPIEWQSARKAVFGA